MTDILASKVADPRKVLHGSAVAPADDFSEGMSYLHTLPKRLVTLYLPLGIIVVVLLFPFYWMALTAIKPDEQLSISKNSIRSGPRRRPSSTSSSSCSRAPIRIGCGTP